jgi:hypothetical protein
MEAEKDENDEQMLKQKEEEEDKKAKENAVKLPQIIIFDFLVFCLILI